MMLRRMLAHQGEELPPKKVNLENLTRLSDCLILRLSTMIYVRNGKY